MKKSKLLLSLVSCFIQAQAYDTTPKGEKLYQQAQKAATPQEVRQLFIQSCEAGNSDICNTLGVAYERGTGIIEKNLSQAMKYYKKACNGHHATGCKNIGNLYAFGDGVEQDSAKAMEYFKKGCDSTDKDNVGACYQLAVGYDKGYGVIQNEPKAMSYFQKACDKIDVDKGYGGNACYNLAVAYNYGNVVAIDRVKAKQYAQKSCNAGNEHGCKLLNMIP